MTSQIILGNYSGVAIASDSASFNSRTAAVTLNHHKLVDLGLTHRVVVAVAASLWQDGTPQTAALREWANTLTEPLLKLEDYASSFRDWHQISREPISRNRTISNIRGYLSDHYAFVAQRVLQLIDSDYSSYDLLDGLYDFINEQIKIDVAQSGYEWLQSLPNYEGVTDDFASQLLTEFEIEVDNEIARSCFSLGMNDEFFDILRKSAPLVLSRAQYMPTYSTDLHFVGYGSSESNPGFIEVSNRGTVGSVPLHLIGEVIRVGPGDEEFSYLVQSIAQDSAISGFIYGADLDIPNHVRASFSRGLAELDKGSNAELEELLDEVWDYVDENLPRIQREAYTNNFLSLVTNATLERLAEMSRTLVELQKLRSEAQPSANTVGGDVDVAVITATSGVQWVRGRAAD